MEVFEALAQKVEGSSKLIDLRKEIDDFIKEGKFDSAKLRCEKLIDKMKQSGSKLLLQDIVDLTYSIRGKYMNKNEIQIGTYVNAEVEFIPKARFAEKGYGLKRGDPGFTIFNNLNEEFDCYIKEMPDLKVGDEVRLLVTNINWKFNAIYLEPRIEVGDIIYAKSKGVGKKEEPMFRFLSYDGFVKIFDENYQGTRRVEKGRDYKMKAIYSKLSITRNRVGILFTHALEKVSGQTWKDNRYKVFKNK